MGRKYDDDFREYLIKLVLEGNKKQTEIAREMDVPLGTLYRWVGDYKKKLDASENGVEYLTPNEQKQRESIYEKQIKELQEENEILKKAMHIFAKNPK